jgi:hypothetical protein
MEYPEISSLSDGLNYILNYTATHRMRIIGAAAAITALCFKYAHRNTKDNSTNKDLSDRLNQNSNTIGSI